MELGIINANNVQLNANAGHVVHAAPEQNPASKVAPVAQSDSRNKATTENNGSGGGQGALGDQERQEIVERGSEAIKRAFTPKMVRFTIFKGPDGNYITRFTDLADGSVRYIPEPEIIDYMRRIDELAQALVDTSA